MVTCRQPWAAGRPQVPLLVFVPGRRRSAKVFLVLAAMTQPYQLRDFPQLAGVRHRVSRLSRLFRRRT